MPRFVLINTGFLAMEGICPKCKKEEASVGFTCPKCEVKTKICSDCMPSYECAQCIVEEKLKSEEELYAYIFFQPREETSILDSLINNEVLQFGKKSAKTAGFSYPTLLNKVPIEKIPCYFSASCYLDDNLFIVAGGLFEESDTVFYSVGTSFIVQGDLYEWELFPIPPLKQPKHCHQLLILGERLYVLGGINKDYNTELKFLSDCEYLEIPKLKDRLYNSEYPLVSDDSKWTSIAQINVKRAQFSSFVHSGTIYVFGGYSNSQVQENSIERYHASTNKWELLKDVKLGDKVANPFLAEALCLTGTNADEFYFLGGTNGKERSNAVYAYNAKENKIDEICRLKHARSGAHGFADGNTLYILGGDSATLSFEKITLKDGKATAEFIEPDFEEPVESVNFEGIQGLFLGVTKTQNQLQA